MAEVPTVIAAESASRRRPTWQRWGLRSAIALLAYTTLGFLVLPLLVRSIAVSQLKKLLNREVAIRQVRFNPFSFVAEVNDLTITDPDGEALLAWQQVRVNFQFTSLFHGPWRVREISVVQPAVRVQVNPDYSFNFSDLQEKLSAPPDPEPSDPKPLPRLVIDSLQIQEAAATYSDLTTSTPFRRRIFPVSLRAPNFSTLAGHTNTFELQAATDAGEQFSFIGSLLLAGPEIQGRLDLEGLQLTNFAAFYQDFVRFQLRDGSIALSTEPHVRIGPTNRLATVANTRFTLKSLKLGLPDSPANLVELDSLKVVVPEADAWERNVHVRSVLVDGVRLQIHRRPDHSVELIEAAKPAETTNAPPASALIAFSAITNAVAAFTGNTNVGLARLDAFLLTNTAVNLLDETPGQTARLGLSEITASLRDLSTLPDASPTAQLTLLWQTNGALAVDLQAKIHPPTLDVAIDLEGWDLSFADPYVGKFVHAHLHQSELSFNGRAHLEAPPETPPSGTFDGSLHLTNLQTSHASDSGDLLQWDAFSIRGIHANLHPLDVTIDQVELAGPQLWATLHEDGTVNLLTAANITNTVGASIPGSTDTAPAAPLPRAPGPPATTAQPETAPAPALPPIRITSVLLTNAVLRISDELAEPDAHLVVNPLNGELRNLSSTNLQKADLHFSGQFEPAGSFTVQGELRPLDGPDPVRLNLTTRGIDLSPTSPYIQRFLGYELDRGAVSTELRYEVTQRQLQGENRVILDRFTLGEKVDSPDALNLPIKLGLKVLQDRQGRIDLSVPVEGSLDDPQFNIAKVISGAFANVFTKVLTSPFSVLGGMFGGDKDEDLQRLQFGPGAHTLTPDLSDQAGKLERILYERPALGLEITGSADPARDRDALKQIRLVAQLRDLEPTPASQDPSANATLPPLSDADTDRLIAQAYVAARGITFSTTPVTEPPLEPAPLPQAQPANSPPPQTAAPAGLRPKPRLPGGARMMQDRWNRPATSSPVETAESTPEPVTPAPPAEDLKPTAQPVLPPIATMRRFLLDAITVTDTDLAQLARQRAESVHAAILKSGRIEPERVVVKELAGPPPAGTDVRLNLL